MEVKSLIMLQKYFLLVFILNLGSCASIKSQNANQCELIEVTLNSESVQGLLSFGDAKNPNASIRITDLSGKLSDCRSYYKYNDTTLFEYFTVDKISPTVNTGHYRDIIVLKVNQEGDRFLIELTAASFTEVNNKQSNHKVTLEIEKGKTYNVVEDNSTNWLDKPPPVDYESIEK